MRNSMKVRRPIPFLPRAILSEGQQRALAEAYSRMVRGQGSANVRAGYVASHLVPLKAAIRALDQGADPKEVLAFYAVVNAQVMALCAGRIARETLTDASLEEQAANYELDRAQITLGVNPSEGQVLTVLRGATHQAARSLTLAQRCAQILGLQPCQ